MDRILRFGALGALVFCFSCVDRDDDVDVVQLPPAQPPAVVKAPTVNIIQSEELARFSTDTEALGADRAYDNYDITVHQVEGIDLTQPAPTFELTDPAGRRVVLKQYVDEGKPVMVFFYRGSWSPTSVAQLRWLNRIYPELQASGTEVVAITPDPPAEITAVVRDNAIAFPVLSDADGRVAQSYRVAYQPDPDLTTQLTTHGVNLPERMGTPTPWLTRNSVFLVNPTGAITWRALDNRYADVIDFNQALVRAQQMSGTTASERAEESSASERAESSSASDRAEGSQTP